MHNVLIIFYIAFSIGKLFILPEPKRFQGSVIKNIPISTKNGSILIFCEVMRINCLCREHHLIEPVCQFAVDATQ